MGIPARLRNQEGQFALVDGIPFHMPVRCRRSPALFAVFPIDADRARDLIPCREVHPFRLWNRGLLVVTVIDYRDTTIGKYIEYSVAIACTHGPRLAPRLLPGLFMKHYGTGQWVFDLPVSSEISVKGGKGIWGMPKHQANLNYIVSDRTVSSQYDLDGQLAVKIEIDRPASEKFPMSMAAANYCAFRGMLMKSYIHFKGKAGFALGKKARARLTIGDHPRVQPLKTLGIDPQPLVTAFIPEAEGILDDHFENWFLTYDTKPTVQMEGLESVTPLGLSEAWLPPPTADADQIARGAQAGRQS